MAGKIRIRILADEFAAAAEDSILRALQLFGIERRLPDYGFTRFCWNAKCKQCLVDFTCDGERRRDFACQTEVRPGLQVHSLPEVLMWSSKVKSES